MTDINDLVGKKTNLISNKSVVAIDSVTGVIKYTFNSAADASNKLDIDNSTISKHCKLNRDRPHNNQKIAKTYIFRYTSDIINEKDILI